MTISIQFFGAARQVTGSRHLVTVGDRRVLLDCGMVQGPRRISNKLNTRLSFEAKDVDAVVLSHAHIDHSGSLPRLVKLGYRGPIYCTHATRDLLEILLPDSAHLQEYDARHLRKHGHSFEPAYDGADVERTLKLVRTVDYHESVEVTDGVTATFVDAGHILGSAQVLLEANDGENRLRIGFTGDCGRAGLPILRDPDPLPACDVLVTESTYGNRLHPDKEGLQEQIRAVLQEEQGRGGRILIPAFSVGRTQNVLWYLGNLIDAGELEPVRIFVDSPLSTKATNVVARHPELFDDEARAALESGRDPFFFPGVRCVADVEESKRLNGLEQGIIISASGMCEGGRILHHLLHTLHRPQDCVLIVGFQASGTLGRRLLDGYEHVKIFGERHSVDCRIRYVDGLSVHADQRELLEHLRPLAQDLERTFVVHGEEDAAMRFVDRLEGAGFRDVVAPVYKESFTLRP